MHHTLPAVARRSGNSNSNCLNTCISLCSRVSARISGGWGGGGCVTEYVCSTTSTAVKLAETTYINTVSAWDADENLYRIIIANMLLISRSDDDVGTCSCSFCREREFVLVWLELAWINWTPRAVLILLCAFRVSGDGEFVYELFPGNITSFAKSTGLIVMFY